MACCVGNIIPFGAVAETSVPYTGPAPLVQVVYFADGIYRTNPHSSNVRFVNGTVKIDHGGVSTGFVVVK